MVKILETNLNQLCDEQLKVNWIADPEQVAKWLIDRHSFSKGINFQRLMVSYPHTLTLVVASAKQE